MHLTHGTTQDLEDTVYSPCVKCGSQTNHCSPLFHLVTNRRLLLGHRPIARSSPREDHRRALNAACIRQVLPDWTDQQDCQEDVATLGSVQLRQTLAL